MVRRNHRFLRDIDILPCEEFIIQHQSLICDFKIRKINNTRRKFAFMKKIWKRHEDCGNSNFLSYIKYKESSQHISTSTLRVVKKILLLKGIGMFWMELCWMLQIVFVDDKMPAQARYTETWRWNNNVSVSENWKLWKEWKQPNTSKERYL